MKLKPLPQSVQLSDASKCQQLCRFIEIYHPGYEIPIPLICLRACDEGGIDYGLVYYACRIIAGNIWTENEGQGSTGPFLSTSLNPSHPRFTPENDIISPGRYYFHVPPYAKGKLFLWSNLFSSFQSNLLLLDPPYPIVPDFDHWVFPSTLPKPWADLQIAPPTRPPAKSVFDLSAYDVRLTSYRITT